MFWSPEDRCRRCGSTYHGTFYHEYILDFSSAWQVFRQRAFERYGRQCSNCGSTYEVEVHHMTYRRLGHERLEDVRILCGPCHRRFHGMSTQVGGFRPAA